MKPNLVTTEQAHYEAREWEGDHSGLIPIGDSVVILPDEASEKIGKLGLLVAPDHMVDRQSLAAETGLVIAVGDGAFVWSADRARPFTGRKPVPGERVNFARYSGQIMIGKDGLSYRVMSDKSIGAIAT